MSVNQAKPWENQSVCKRMAQLLRNCKHEEQYRWHQWMALSQNTHVYMETMEIAQNKEEKSYKNGNPWILCEHGGKLSKGTLVLCQSDDSQEGHDKRKTDKQWLLWFSHSLSVCARQLLKPPCTERYARWCERTAVSHRLLLDSGHESHTKTEKEIMHKNMWLKR